MVYVSHSKVGFGKHSSESLRGVFHLIANPCKINQPDTHGGLFCSGTGNCLGTFNDSDDPSFPYHAS